MPTILENAVAELASGRDFALVTVVACGGSVPAVVGAKMIVSRDGTSGTVGGGALEKHAVDRAREILGGSGGAMLLDIDLAGLGMACGGRISVFVEPHRAAPELWIFGLGHVGVEVVPLGAAVGFRVVAVDNRAELADPHRAPQAARVIHSEYGAAARDIPAGAYAVIVTHGHAHDQEVLLELARRDPPLAYIGMIGSASKVPQALEHLRRSGVEPGPNIFAPIGLDLGGGSPAEIALSIAAEILAVRHGKTDLPHCRERRMRGG